MPGLRLPARCRPGRPSLIGKVAPRPGDLPDPVGFAAARRSRRRGGNGMATDDSALRSGPGDANSVGGHGRSAETGRLADRLASARLQYFVGRHEELALFRRALAGEPGAPMVIVLHGPGGMGKSALLQRASPRRRAPRAVPSSASTPVRSSSRRRPSRRRPPRSSSVTTLSCSSTTSSATGTWRSGYATASCPGYRRAPWSSSPDGTHRTRSGRRTWRGARSSRSYR